ncbi:MAG: cyclic nucleotide-binding domain-containing protein [Ardenticatenaceae bacterium]|nr:cyclic nucleotide-binding domain-containing protein [Ardenticatenaceae bacterium]
MDAVLGKLYDESLLDPLSDEDLARLARSTELQQFKPGEYVYLAGDSPTHFYLVTNGQLEVLEPTERGERRRQYLYPQDFFGDIALREDTPRQFAVRAALPSEVIAIPAAAFFELLDAFPEIEKILDQSTAERRAPPPTFPGQYENEVVIYWARRHPIELLRRLLWPVGVGLVWTVMAVIALFVVARQSVRWETIILTVWAIGLIPLTMWALWEGIDWWNDLYIVTDQRVINLERVVLIFEERREAPILKVQNVNAFRRNPLAAALNYGDLVIETAAQTGAILFRAVPDNDVVAARILQERDKAREAVRRASESQKRRELRKALGLEPTSPPPAKQDGGVQKNARRPRRISEALATQGMRYFIPRTREEQGETIIWRKHWIVLLGQTLRPWLFTIVIFFSAIALGVMLPPLSAVATFLIILFFAIAGMAAVGWLLWEYEDWHNDIYILSPTAVVDEERRPLALSKTVKQASLDQIQDVRYEIPNPLFMLLNVGNVVIQTAGAEGRLDFKFVKNPPGIQSEIFRHIQRMAEERQARESARLNAEILDALRLYQEEVGTPPDRSVPQA